jgi:hypothetical protein
MDVSIDHHLSPPLSFIFLYWPQSTHYHHAFIINLVTEFLSAGALHIGHMALICSHFTQHAWQQMCPHRPAQGREGRSVHTPHLNRLACMDDDA